jgi:hypothetical protein
MKKRFVLITISALSAGAAVQAAEETYVPPSYSTQTHAQVQADLAAWHAAGLSAEWRGNHTPDIYSTAYRAKLADYQQRLAHQQANSSVVGK